MRDVIGYFMTDGAWSYPDLMGPSELCCLGPTDPHYGKLASTEITLNVLTPETDTPVKVLYKCRIGRLWANQEDQMFWNRSSLDAGGTMSYLIFMASQLIFDLAHARETE